MSSYNLPADAPIDTRFQAFFENVTLWNLYSQNCEDSILAAIFDRIGTENKWCFECGAADGLFFSNTRRLIDQGWQAVLVEPNAEDYRRLLAQFNGAVAIHIYQSLVVADPKPSRDPWWSEMTIDEVLAHAKAPIDIDLLSLDIDSQEYYILNSMIRFRPRVVVVEYDPLAAPMFIPELRGKGQAGRLAMFCVAQARGYEVVGRTKTNLICVRADLAPLLMANPQAATV